MLDECIKTYKQYKSDTSKQTQLPTQAKYKKDYPFLKKLNSLALANVQQYLDKAYQKFSMINPLHLLNSKVKSTRFKVIQRIIKGNIRYVKMSTHVSGK